MLFCYNLPFSFCYYFFLLLNTLHIYNYQGERTRNPTNAGKKKIHIKNVIQLEISKNENSRKIREIILLTKSRS
jgi:hypothetical protein